MNEFWVIVLNNNKAIGPLGSEAVARAYCEFITDLNPLKRCVPVMNIYKQNLWGAPLFYGGVSYPAPNEGECYDD